MSVFRLDDDQRQYFRDALRDARASALRDAEGFDAIIHVIERFGGFIRGVEGDSSRGGLMKALRAIAPLVERSGCEVLPEHRGFHIPFDRLSRQVAEARNAAFHEGAFARHLTGDAILLAVCVEDALMADKMLVSDYMIRRPICAHLWQPLSFIRQTMLSQSFSHLPVNLLGGREADWRLVADADLALFTRTPDRDQRLRMSLGVAVANGLELKRPYVCGPETSVEDALKHCDGFPVLITLGAAGNSHDASQLIGFASPFDLL